METEATRRAAGRGLVCFALAWACHAVIDFGSLDVNRFEEPLIVVALAFGVLSFAGAVLLFRASPPSLVRPLLLIVLVSACAEAAVFFFYHQPRVLRCFGGASGALLAVWLAHAYGTRRYAFSVALASVAIALGGVVSVLDGAFRLASGRWFVEADTLFRTMPNLRSLPTLVLSACLVALALDLRTRLRADLRLPARPTKQRTSPWRFVRSTVLFYYRAVLGRLVAGVVLGLLLVLGANREILAGLTVGADVLMCIVSTLAFSRIAHRAPATRHLAAATAASHVFAALVILFVQAELAAVAVIATVFTCAELGAIGRDVRDASLPRLANEGAFLSVAGGLATAAILWLLKSMEGGDIGVADRAAALELIPLAVAFPLATTLAVVLILRRTVFVLRAPMP